MNLFPTFFFVIRRLVLESRKNTEIEYESTSNEEIIQKNMVSRYLN